MAEELLLHASKEQYETLIGQLDGKIGQLKSTLSSYQNLKQRVNNFVQEGDSNFANMQANVDANIDAVQRAIALASKSKDNLQKTVDQMDDMSTKTATMMQEAAETAGNAIKTAIRLDGLGL